MINKEFIPTVITLTVIFILYLVLWDDYTKPTRINSQNIVHEKNMELVKTFHRDKKM